MGFLKNVYVSSLISVRVPLGFLRKPIPFELPFFRALKVLEATDIPSAGREFL